MHYLRDMSGDTLAEQMNPAFRKVSFSDESAVVTISTLLRKAWTIWPPETLTANSLGDWMSAYSRKTPEEQAAAPGNKDFSLHTVWRDLVYEMFNHVFCDINLFLQEACRLEGAFKPPAHEAFALPFPAAPSSSSAASTILGKNWSVSVYMMPAYVAEGVTVRAYRIEDRYGTYGDEGKELAKFNLDGEEKFDVWYILPGTKIKFVIEVPEGDHIETSQTVAAIMVAGLLTKMSHTEGDEDQQEGKWMGLAA